MDSKLAQLRRNETKKRREAWINTDGLRYLCSQRQGEPRQETAAGDSTKNNPPPWRISITEILFKSSVDQSQEERLKLFHSLQYLSIIKYGSARIESIYSCPYNGCARRWKPFATKKSLDLHSRSHEQKLYQVLDSGYASHLEDSSESSTDASENSQPPTILKKPDKTQHVCPHQHCLRHTRPFPCKRDLVRHCDRIHGTLEQYCPNQHCVRSKRPFTNKHSLARHLRQAHS